MQRFFATSNDAAGLRGPTPQWRTTPKAAFQCRRDKASATNSFSAASAIYTLLTMGKFTDFKLRLNSLPEGKHDFSYHLGKEFFCQYGKR